MGTIILTKKDMLSRAELKNAFNEIDTDGSGAIDIGELANLCGKVNVADVDQTNTEALFKEIDTNHDGKISFEEFTAWYRLGRNSKLRDVLKYSIKALTKFDAHFTKKYNKASAYDGEGRTTLVDVEIRDGEPSESNTDGCIRATTKADEELSDRVGRACPNLQVRLGEGHESMLPAGTRAFACFTIRSSNAEALAQAFRDFYQSAKDLLLEMDPSMVGLFDAVKYHVGTDEDWVVVASDAAGNPFVEQFVFMGVQGLELVNMAEPEIVWRSTTDVTWDSLRTAEDMKNIIDNTRFKCEVSVNTAGRKQLQEVLSQMLPPDAVNMSKMFKGFTFKAKANSKEQAGGLNQNFQQMLQAMSALDNPQALEMHSVMNVVNELPFKTWADCIKAVKEQAGCEHLEEAKTEMNNYPFVKDFLNSFRAHAVADMNTSIFFNNCQLSSTGRTKGFGTCFNEVWEALGL